MPRDVVGVWGTVQDERGCALDASYVAVASHKGQGSHLAKMLITRETDK